MNPCKHLRWSFLWIYLKVYYFHNKSSIIDVIAIFKVKLRWSKSSQLLQRVAFLVKVWSATLDGFSEFSERRFWYCFLWDYFVRISYKLNSWDQGFYTWRQILASWTLQRKWSFSLRISSVNMAKYAVSSGFGHIYRRIF